MTNTVLDFRPTRHGFHFANRFPAGPTVMFGAFDIRWLGVGDAAAGLCGGMALTVRDLFEARVDPPPDAEPPANGTPRFKALVRRQVQSLDWLRVPYENNTDSCCGASSFRSTFPVMFWLLNPIGSDPPR